MNIWHGCTNDDSYVNLLKAISTIKCWTLHFWSFFELGAKNPPKLTCSISFKLALYPKFK